MISLAKSKALKKYFKKQYILTAAFTVLVLLSALVNFSDNPAIPTWDELSVAANVYDGANLINDNELSVHFLAVGNADSILISCNGYNILIDAGEMTGKNTTTNYLHRCGICELDLVINTHPDIDHIYEMPKVLSEFKVKRFWTCKIDNEMKPNSIAYTSIMETLNKNKTPITYVKTGDSITFGKLHLYVISPSKQYKEFNDNSVVIKMVYEDTTWLFMGDAEKEAEKDILDSGIDINCDVIKVGHHGSNSSSTREFLDAAAPKLTVLTVSGENNSLPSNKVIERYNKAGIKLLRTDLNGNITIVSDGEKIETYTDK